MCMHVCKLRHTHTHTYTYTHVAVSPNVDELSVLAVHCQCSVETSWFLKPAACTGFRPTSCCPPCFSDIRDMAQMPKGMILRFTMSCSISWHRRVIIAKESERLYTWVPRQRDYTLSMSLYVSLSHTRTRTHARTHARTHTHTHTHTPPVQVTLGRRTSVRRHGLAPRRHGLAPRRHQGPVS